VAAGTATEVEKKRLGELLAGAGERLKAEG